MHALEVAIVDSSLLCEYLSNFFSMRNSMKHKNALSKHLIILLLLAILFGGCQAIVNLLGFGPDHYSGSLPPAGPGPSQPDADAYRSGITSTGTSIVGYGFNCPQTYLLCKAKETRPFYVGGTRRKSTQIVISVLDGSNSVVTSAAITNQQNAYLNNSTGEYTVPLYIDVPDPLTYPYKDEMSYKLKIGNWGFTQDVDIVNFTIYVVPSREQKVDYEYANGYDVFPLGTDASNSVDLLHNINLAFDHGGTKITLDPAHPI